MTPKEAIAVARDYVAELFAAEGARNIGLEELRFEPETDRWSVTIGFTREWEEPKGIMSRITESDGRWPRTFKTVEIADDGRVLELRHWPVAA